MTRKMSARAPAIMLSVVLMFTTLMIDTFGAQAQLELPQKRMTIVVEGSDKPADILDQLLELDLVPSGGKIGLQIQSTWFRPIFVNARQEGPGYLRIGRGTRLRNMVFHFEMRVAEMYGKTNGCGMAFRIIDDDNFSFLMLTRDRKVVLGQRKDGKFIVNFEESVDEMEGIDASTYEVLNDLHIITLVAVDENLTLFLNGVEITTETTAFPANGVLAMMLFNERGNTRATLCRYSNVWAWSFD